ncbi:hypothetical protein N7G274_001916 [Stereocaulon virgatum]|uniref:Jacalin-type lectin domain-containing protein n=1 Tax=Stereocaulon virgatum TaxID=373712 RepID=A0ABR4APX5_9LECA
MPFFKELRRRKTGLKQDKSQDSSTDSNSNDSNGTVPPSKSSSTLNSVYGSSTTTPPSSIQPHQSTPTLPKSKSATTMASLPHRPMPLSGTSNRSSYIQGLNAPSINGSITPKVPTSAFAPRIVSISNNSWVHQKVLLVYGQIGEPSEKMLDGILTVSHHQDNFPATVWPVSDSHFKALVHLTPGPNHLRFDFSSPKVASNNSSVPAHSTHMSINFLPLINSPPLQLVILLGKDSPATFDAVPERKQREGNDLGTAIRKFRMAAYLWQAFTGEQMFRHSFGRRCFRFEEEWQTGSLTFRDKELGQMRNEAKVHVIRSDKTVRELRDLDIAQQGENATRKGELYAIAMEAVKAYFKPVKGQKQYISLLLLDSHWDTKAKTITGHAALGGGSGEVQLAIFGSQALQSYPTCIEEVVPAFSDCTRTNTNFVANDCNESGSNWEAANIGIGAHLHETGHLFGCPHQESGIMLRDYVRFNRTFLCREPYSTRTKSPGLRRCLPKDECGWHRLDALRFKNHPCFQLPTDVPLKSDDSLQIWPADNGKVIITAPTGIAFIEIFSNGDDICHTWIEYCNGDAQSAGPPRQVVLTESDLKARLPEDTKAKKLKIKAHSVGQGSREVDDFALLVKSKNNTVKLPNGQSGFKGCRLGESRLEGSQPEQVILETAHKQTKLLTSIKIYHGFALDGLEFCYEDSTSQLFGKKGGTPGGSEFNLDTRRGEILTGFHLRAGLWIDGIEILTSLGRKSGVYGNPTGGSDHTLMPPRGYSIAGVSGSCGQWVDGFSLIITR